MSLGQEVYIRLFSTLCSFLNLPAKTCIDGDSGRCNVNIVACTYLRGAGPEQPCIWAVDQMLTALREGLATQEYENVPLPEVSATAREVLLINIH